MRFLVALGFASVALTFLGAGCTFQFGQSEKGVVFKSLDSGNTWQSISVMTVGKRKIKLGTVDATRILVDPHNSKVLYLGTIGRGLFISNTGGENWTQLLQGQTVVDIATDPSAKCTLYALTPIHLLKTTDCGERWVITNTEARAKVAFSSIAIDPFLPQTLYVASSGGDIFKSTDGGARWFTPSRITHPVARLFVDPIDSTVLFMASTDGFVYRSPNKADTWEDISGSLHGPREHMNYRWIAPLAESNGVFFATDQYLFTTLNGGRSWTPIKLLTAPGEAPIFAAATNPLNDAEVYYSTATTYYSTYDHGAHWEVRPLPNSRPAGIITIDPQNAGTVYIGFIRVQDAASQIYFRQGPWQTRSR